MDMKKFQGLMKALPEKRYKSFVTTVADLCEVWLLVQESEGYATIDSGGYIHLLIWPEEEFAINYKSLHNEYSKDKVTSIEVHEFCDRCLQYKEQKNLRFMVFPTEENVTIVEVETLLNDIQEQLELVE